MKAAGEPQRLHTLYSSYRLRMLTQGDKLCVSASCLAGMLPLHYLQPVFWCTDGALMTAQPSASPRPKAAGSSQRPQIRQVLGADTGIEPARVCQLSGWHAPHPLPAGRSLRLAHRSAPQTPALARCRTPGALGPSALPSPPQSAREQSLAHRAESHVTLASLL